MFARDLDLRGVLRVKSALLLGPRQTGKSTLLRQTFPEALFVDLLEPTSFRQLSAAPERLSERVRAADAPVVIIDEVQKLPALLDSVHRLIEQDKRRRFLLTGSSARKLRRGGTNLLGGRAGVTDPVLVHWGAGTSPRSRELVAACPSERSSR